MRGSRNTLIVVTLLVTRAVVSATAPTADLPKHTYALTSWSRSPQPSAWKLIRVRGLDPGKHAPALLPARAQLQHAANSFHVRGADLLEQRLALGQKELYVKAPRTSGMSNQLLQSSLVRPVGSRLDVG